MRLHQGEDLKLVDEGLAQMVLDDLYCSCADKGVRCCVENREKEVLGRLVLLKRLYLEPLLHECIPGNMTPVALPVSMVG